MSDDGLKMTLRRLGRFDWEVTISGPVEGASDWVRWSTSRYPIGPRWYAESVGRRKLRKRRKVEAWRTQAVEVTE